MILSIPIPIIINWNLELRIVTNFQKNWQICLCSADLIPTYRKFWRKIRTFLEMMMNRSCEMSGNIIILRNPEEGDHLRKGIPTNQKYWCLGSLIFP